MSNIHAMAQSGYLLGLQTLLFQDPALLNKRANTTSETPLHVAARHNRVEIVKCLLKWKELWPVDLEAKDIFGETPLKVAAKNGCNDIVKLLLASGANAECIAASHQNIHNFTAGAGQIYPPAGNSSYTTAGQIYPPAGNSSYTTAGQIYPPAGNSSYTTAGQIYPPAGNSSYTVAMNSLSKGYRNELQQPDGNYDDNNEIKRKLDEFDLELSTIVGLHNLKQQLRQWAKGMLLDEKRRSMGMNLGPRKLPHMAFLGNPGTGKTTIGRMIGKLLHSIGVLSSDTMIEVQRTDLIGEYVGQTGPKTKKKIEEAMGGILFVDEAYQLVPKQSAGTSVDYGKEALEEIMSVLEDGNLVVVFAGYTEPMKSVFSSNEGFCRRVTHHFQFDDYSCRDLAEMLMIKMTKQNEKSRLYGFKLHPYCTYEAVLAVIERNSTEKLRNKLNGGLVDHMMNNARESLDSRLHYNSNGDELSTITIGDLEAGLRMLSQRLNVG